MAGISKWYILCPACGALSIDRAGGWLASVTADVRKADVSSSYRLVAVCALWEASLRSRPTVRLQRHL